MKKTMNIIEDVLKAEDFTEDQSIKFKEMLKIMTENVELGLHADLNAAIQSVIERADNNEN